MDEPAVRPQPLTEGDLYATLVIPSGIRSVKSQMLADTWQDYIDIVNYARAMGEVPIIFQADTYQYATWTIAEGQIVVEIISPMFSQEAPDPTVTHGIKVSRHHMAIQVAFVPVP